MVKPNFYLPCRRYFLTVTKMLVVIVLSIMFFASCSISKPTYIFKDIKKDTVIQGFTDTDVELKIQKNDLLNLSVSSLNPTEDLLFNSVLVGTTTGKTDAAPAGYLVSLDGNIYLHKLGSVMVTGMTLKELKLKLEKDFLPYLKDPVVTVNFANHFITVMGEAGTSQKLNMPGERISLIDAIALSGNVTAAGTLKNVLVIRESPGSKEFKHLNLENESIFTSPWYYLQPKDVLVLNPNEEKIYKEQTRARNQQVFATVLSALSIVLIVINLILRK